MAEKKGPKPQKTKAPAAKKAPRGSQPKTVAPKARVKPLAKPASKPRRAVLSGKELRPRIPATGRRGLPKSETAPPLTLAAATVLEPPTAGLSEEERIESSKYDVQGRPRRFFEEERFLFPETYEADRVRLLVKDPEWLFAHWDVSPGALQRVRADVGERAMALSRLTLKVEDPANGALSIVLLPEGARSWYVRTQLQHRAYRAQLGLTMPSGEFRALATSNVVVAPRFGPSPERASRRVAFRDAQVVAAAAQPRPRGDAEAGAAADRPVVRAEAESVAYIDGDAGRPEPDSSLPDRGGASEMFSRGGASDLFRR